MMVVSDGSPLDFLIRLGCIDVLPNLYGSVLIPPIVLEECSHLATPANVQQFMSRLPDWIRVRAPKSCEVIPKLDAGEMAAIHLALEVGADFVFLDDWAARLAAGRRGLAVTGLLGILERADENSFLELSAVVHGFPADYRIDRALIDAALARSHYRRR